MTENTTRNEQTFENKSKLKREVIADALDSIKKSPKFIAKYIGVPLLTLATIYGTFHSTETKQLKAKGYTEYNTVVFNQKGSSKGILIGFINTVYGKMTGLQIGVCNPAKGAGLAENLPLEKNNDDNELTLSKGAQVGIINEATTLENAVQIGCKNACGTHEGFYLQLGGWNTSEDRSTILINFGYKSKDETQTLDSKVDETNSIGGE